MTGRRAGTGDVGDPAGRVELVYRATAGEFREALRASESASAAGRWGRGLLVGSALLGVLGGALPLALGGRADPKVPVMLAVALLGLVVLPWWQARYVHRRAAARGEHRAVVDDWGVTVTHTRGSDPARWQRMAGYAETRRAFVLLGRAPYAVVLLPKRGARGPQDVARLRALLDRNLSRA
ncbi:YcxB family protein [Streptomyces sp. NPDC008313]|uniref:YcxB family protein n=1 Tax=Streptomyces sp. NPDC008313 TaxID=3364826 RepID=UPI0036E3B7A3